MDTSDVVLNVVDIEGNLLTFIGSNKRQSLRYLLLGCKDGRSN